MHQALKISEAEWRVCQVLWQRSPQTANAIVAELADKTNWNPRTVKTLLNRLIKKKVLGYQIQGREYLYFPRIGEEECVLAQTQSFVKRVFHGAAGTMLATFLNSQQLSSREIAELKKMLREKTAKQ